MGSAIKGKAASVPFLCHKNRQRRTPIIENATTPGIQKLKSAWVRNGLRSGRHPNASSNQTYNNAATMQGITKFGTEYCFVVYVFSVLYMSYSNRTENGFYTIDPFKNPLLLFSIVASICVLLIMTMIPFVVEFFTPRDYSIPFTPLQFDQILKCALLALLAPAFNELWKILKKKFIKV